MPNFMYKQWFVQVKVYKIPMCLNGIIPPERTRIDGGGMGTYIIRLYNRLSTTTSNLVQYAHHACWYKIMNASADTYDVQQIYIIQARNLTTSFLYITGKFSDIDAHICIVVSSDEWHHCKDIPADMKQEFW